MTQTANNKKIRPPRAAYMGFLFQTFLKRPFGYIIAVLFLVYLAVILLIVPASLHFEPLFIWNVGGFNMPIFNLFFIAGSAASIAVAVFRTGRDDGTDLNLSAKPFNKGITVGMKTAVFLIIMFIVCLLTVAIAALIWPIFGEYNEVTNITGIAYDKYVGLLLSLFVGNIVNMLFFGGIAVFISMIGGQVIIIIGSIAVVFVMMIVNFLMPQVLTSATDVLSNKYDTEIMSYSCNTLHQYENPKEGQTPLNFAAIQRITDESYEEEYPYDTKEYWDKACRESGRQAGNYIDFGKQLSMIYSSFGLDESKLKEASKLVIGSNNAYNYEIDETTHISSSDNVSEHNYPIAYYGMTVSQGKTYPLISFIGGDMTLSTSNWYLLTTLFQLDFNSVSFVSNSPTSSMVTNSIQATYTKPWNRMMDLRLSQEQADRSEELYHIAYDAYTTADPTPEFNEVVYNTITTDDSGLFFEAGKYEELPAKDKLDVMAKLHLNWAILAQQDQMRVMKEYFEVERESYTYPYTSKAVVEWYDAEVGLEASDQGVYKKAQQFNNAIFNNAFYIGKTKDEYDETYDKLVVSKVKYAETFANFYQYSVSNFYNIYSIIAIWTILSCGLFATAVIVYKKTDFK